MPSSLIAFIILDTAAAASKAVVHSQTITTSFSMYQHNLFVSYLVLFIMLFTAKDMINTDFPKRVGVTYSRFVFHR